MNDDRRPKSQLPEWPSVPHYYGDVVRALFLGCAIVVGLMAPLSGSVGVGLVIAMPIVLVLIVLAGFTNPHSTFIMVLDTIASVLGIMLAEVFAVVAFESEEMLPFLIFEAIAFTLCIALYFSVKNVRAAMMHRIGKIDGADEFNDPSGR